MFKWSVMVGKTILDEGDWGKDIVTGIGVSNIDNISLVDQDLKVLFYPKIGVIRVENTHIGLGVTIDGYPYKLEDECFAELKEIAPFTTAEYAMDTKKSTKLDRHLFVKYKVTHLIDKVTRKKYKLSVPVIKVFSIRCGKDTGVSIC